MYKRNGLYFQLSKYKDFVKDHPFPVGRAFATGFARRRRYHEVIPKRVFMTWKTLNLPPFMRANVDKLIAEHPDFEVTVYDDAMCRQFIAEHFTFPVVDAYDTLVPGAYKADLWRLCVLYIHGGIYLDIKYRCVDGFHLSELLDKEHLVLDRPEFWKTADDYGIYNAVMVCLPGSDFLLASINALVWNVQNKIYGHNAMYPTGPGLLGDVHRFRESGGHSLSKTIPPDGRALSKTAHPGGRDLSKTTGSLRPDLSKPALQEDAGGLREGSSKGTYGSLDMAMILNGVNDFGALYAVIYKNRIILETYEEYREEMSKSEDNNVSYVQYYRAGNIYYINSQNNPKYKEILQNSSRTTVPVVKDHPSPVGRAFVKDHPSPVGRAFVSEFIPANVYLTWETSILPVNMFQNMESMIKTNTDMIFKLYTDNMCRDYIRDNYSHEVLHAYDMLVPGAYKADLWRYCILYKEGGIYMDMKITPHVQLSSLLHKEHFVLDIAQHHRELPDAYGIYNGLLVCKAGNPVLKDIINAIIDNVKNKFYGVSSLCPTGPNLLGKLYAKCGYNESDIDMALNCDNPNNQYIVYENKMAFSFYPQYRDEQKMLSNKQHYSKLYLDRSIYSDYSLPQLCPNGAKSMPEA